jgi:two-component system, LytTR family, sensor kinase
MQKGRHKPRWPMWALFLGLWMFFALLASGLLYLHFQLTDRPVTGRDVALLSVVDCFLWVVLALLIYQLVRRFPFEQGRWRGSLLVHVCASVVLSVIKLGAFHAPMAQLFPQDPEHPRSYLESFQVLFTAAFPSFLLMYWLILGACLAVRFYHKYRERELRASQLEAQLAQAQLQVLKMQLHPHFLFNTLHAISALMHQDVELADRMIARLGELLRSTLENGGTQEVSLRQELEFIRPYLEIEQARLGPRLQVRMEIDPEAMDARVPNLLLQPLVENAIRHGVAPRPEGGRIEIRARRDHDRLRLEVCDDGPGLRAEQHTALAKGIGVANTRARLQQLYGPSHRFEMTNASRQGLVVTVIFPFREYATQAVDDSTEVNGEHSGLDRG